jgi:hypothetical protein
MGLTGLKTRHYIDDGWCFLSPVFFVSVDFKKLRCCVSPLFPTPTRGVASVDCKGFTWQDFGQNAARHGARWQVRIPKDLRVQGDGYLGSRNLEPSRRCRVPYRVKENKRSGSRRVLNASVSKKRIFRKNCGY